MRPIDKIFIGYFIILSFILAIRLPWYPYGKWYLLGHIVLIILFYSFLALSRKTKSKFIFFIRQWYPIILFTFMYEEVGRLNHIIFPYFLDPLFARLDEFIFGFQPSLEFQHRVPSRIFGEYMYFSYFFYFLIVFVVAIPMYLKKMYRQFSEALFTVSLTFYFCYIFFIIFPVAGPRCYFPGANMDKLNGYFFAKILKFVLDNAEIEGGAFPSSHVAVAL
ncbi:MAG: phosphatase PAP2 family protein, partial [bacterium]